MECILCERPIENYQPEFNRLKLDSREVDICQGCIDRLLKWQQGIFSKLYPTSAAKRWARKNELI